MICPICDKRMYCTYEHDGYKVSRYQKCRECDITFNTVEVIAVDGLSKYLRHKIHQKTRETYR